MSFDFSKEIVVDLYQNKYVSTSATQYDIDSRNIIIQITNDGKPYPIDSSTVSIKIKYGKSDGKIIFNDIPSENVLSDGRIKITLTDQMCASYGKNEAELLIVDLSTKQIIHTMNFIVNVKKAVFSDEEVSSKDEFKSFENALIRLEYVLNRLQPITKSQIDSLF